MSSALVLIDIQRDYFAGGRMELTGMEQAAIKAKSLLSTFRENRWPTFHIQHIATREGATFFLPDTAGAELHDSIEPLQQEPVLVKHYPNSFRETALEKELRQAGIKHLVICGAMSHMCIDATTRAAADLGFACTVIHDACATRNLEFSAQTIPAAHVHGSFMAALGAAYAKVVSLSEFLAGLQ